MQYCVATFHSVHDALYFEKVFKEIGLNLQLIPVPREISSSCGIAARFSTTYRSDFEKAIADKNLEIDEIFTLEEKPRKRKSLFDLLD